MIKIHDNIGYLETFWIRQKTKDAPLAKRLFKYLTQELTPPYTKEQKRGRQGGNQQESK